MRRVKGRKRGLKKKNRLFAALKRIPNTAYREMMKIYSYIYRCIYNIYKKILCLLCFHSLAVHRTMRKHCKFICSFFFCKFFFQKFFFLLMYKDTFQGLFFFVCVYVCMVSQNWPGSKWKMTLTYWDRSVKLTFRPPGFFLFCLHDVHPYGNHTRLYSFKLSCKMVSLTAANTKRIFSVSEK